MKNASKYGIIAIHGGDTEIGTSEIAKNIAGDNFEYFISSSNSHIKSTKFKSPLLSKSTTF
ncbi:MAG: poly-gamma-glutamate hydrolase family protein [Candidatus Paceibacterota bacterium]